MTRQDQGNPTHDKMSARLELAGADVLGPILRGLGGRVKIEIQRGEILDDVRIFSLGSNKFTKDLLSIGEFENLSDGRRIFSADIVYGIDTDYGVTGSPAVRNYLQWKVTRKVPQNPSGARFTEKAYSDDSDAMKNQSEATMRLDRDWLTPRDYSQQLTGSAIPTGSEASGLAWREDNQTLYVLGDNLRIKVVNREGVETQNEISLSGLGISDSEAIVYMGSDRFAVLDEGVAGGRPVRLHLFHLRQGADTVNPSGIKTYTLSSIEEFPGGSGAEGLAYDRISGKFYVGTQSTRTDEGGLWEVDIGSRNTDGEPTQALLYRWNDTLVEEGHLGNGAILGDLHFSHDLGAGALNQSILCHFRTPDAGGPESNRQVIQIDRDTGRFISKYHHNLGGKWEGFTVDDDSESFFFVREGGGANFSRHDHTKFEDADIFRRQFFVKDKPAKGGLYLNGQEAQLGEAWVFINSTDLNRFAKDAAIGINILPVFSDELFLGGEWEGNLGEPVELHRFISPGVLFAEEGRKRPNRYATTVRNHGGAKTVEVFTDSIFSGPVIPETAIEDLGGYYWPTPSFGLHTVTVRLRAALGSPNYVDIVGYVRFRQFECPAGVS